jgi:hypothetical protein
MAASRHIRPDWATCMMQPCSSRSQGARRGCCTNARVWAHSHRLQPNATAQPSSGRQVARCRRDTSQLAYMPQAAVTGCGHPASPRSNQGHGMGWEGSASTLPCQRRPPWRPCPTAAAPRPGGQSHTPPSGPANRPAGAARRQPMRCGHGHMRHHSTSSAAQETDQQLRPYHACSLCSGRSWLLCMAHWHSKHSSLHTAAWRFSHFRPAR